MNDNPKLSPFAILVSAFKKRGLNKQADLIEDLFMPEVEAVKTECPICDGDKDEPDCLLCSGTGHLIEPATPNDQEDERVEQELQLKSA